MPSPEPFQINFSDDLLAETKLKLEATRYPGEIQLPSGDKWSYGTPLATVKDLVDYWKSSFDWRKIESRLNEMPQFKMSVQAPDLESIDLHFVHKRSSRANAIPLLFIHGWPGNFTEVEKILPLLTEPTDGSQSYHVVAPSLPGFVFSSTPKRPGFDPIAIAATLNQLMLDLNYPTYLAQGGDWGSHISRALGIYHSDNCMAMHLNMFVTPPPSKYNPVEVVKYLAGGYSDQETTHLRETQRFMNEETGYQAIQSTKPQTLNYGLVDSPVAMLAWIREKMETWTDNYPWTSDEVLTWVMLYYGTSNPATLIYKESRGNRATLFAEKIKAPFGVAVFPKELYKVPRSWAEKVGTVVHWCVYEKGGHFAATEQPEVLVKDFQTFVGKLQASKMWVEKAKF